MDKIPDFSSPTKKIILIPQSNNTNNKQKSEKDVFCNKKSLFVDKIDINNLKLSDSYNESGLLESPKNLSK